MGSLKKYRNINKELAKKMKIARLFNISLDGLNDLIHNKKEEGERDDS